jgi:outer membrane protein OmpA-like peptidoglycan-associated protein
MRIIFAATLLAATVWAQDQAPAPANPPQPQQDQQQATPAQPQAAPAPTPSTSETAPPPASQTPAIARTNLTESFNGPTLSEIYCAGFITNQSVKASGTVLAGNESPEQANYSDHEYIYLSGSDVQEGREYLLLRHTHDPNEYESFPGQLGELKKLGQMYQDLGRAKVLYIRNKTAVAQIESSCNPVMPGDIAVPFQERPRPEFKETKFERFAAPNGKMTGHIVMGKELDTEIGMRRVVYLNVGESQGVKPGDYFRITREYSAVSKNPAESLPFHAPAYDPTQKDPSKFDFHKQSGELPRRSLGELMVISTSPSTSAALTTAMLEDVHLGDGIEMIDATPIVTAAPAAAAPPEPPTINCSVSRSTIQVGETSNITCNGVPEEGHTLTYSYQASAGQITPRENRATLTGTAPGPVTVTATAVDDRNLSAQTTMNLDVQAAPVAPSAAAAPTPSLLNELIFKPNSAYVDNRAKAVLDDDALRMQRESNATMILEGSANPSENESLAGQRAENAKTYLSKSKGIDPSRITTRPGQTKTGAKVGVILVPAGANPQ